jgi:2-phosphosulfolactate phosphatase
VARALAEERLDVTLLCAGTDGQIALEDVIGAGAVIDSLARITTLQPACDASKMAALLYRENRHRLDETITETCGGMNIRAAGLGDDVSFAAAVDSLDVVGVVKEIAADCLTLRRAN